MTRPHTVLVDTGPLVALFDPRDPLHARAKGTLKRLAGVSLVSCEAVLTEASHLLGSTRRRVALQTWLDLGHVEVRGPARELRLELAASMTELDYADAVLVHLATVGKLTRVWTYDRRDFSVYRVRGAALTIVD